MPIKWIKYLPHLAAALLLAGALGLAYRAGFQTAFDRQQAVIDKNKSDAEKEKAAAAEAYAAKLESLRNLVVQLEQVKGEIEQRALKMTAEAARRKTEHKKGIEHAIAQDKRENGAACVDGLGPNGLRQYNRALGYHQND